MSDQAVLDWRIVKQLRSMVLTDLREFVPDKYFLEEGEAFKFHDSIANAVHWSSEMRWGYLAGELGRKLFFHSTAIMTARQTSAAEVLMNLGMLAGAEAAQGTSQQLAIAATSKGVSDGNAGAVAEQLRTEHIPTLTNNIRVALKQYLRYLTPFEVEPFLPLLEKGAGWGDGQLLPDDAVRYFELLCTKHFADAWMELEKRQKEFLKTEAENGRTFGGTGFAARVSRLYVDDLAVRARIISVNLKLVHRDFGMSLASGIDDQLASLSAGLLKLQVRGLESAYQRHLGALGIEATLPHGLDLQYPAQQAALTNEIRQYIWILRKVPMKSPDQPTGQPTFIIHGNVGAIQTAPNAVAHVQQVFNAKDFGALGDALMQLSAAIPVLRELDASQRERLTADVSAAEAEITKDVKDETELLKWLAGIGAVVQTLGSAQPAWEAVRVAARSVGLPL